MTDLESDVGTCTPSYALYLAETAEEMATTPEICRLDDNLRR